MGRELYCPHKELETDSQAVGFQGSHSPVYDIRLQGTEVRSTYMGEVPLILRVQAIEFDSAYGPLALRLQAIDLGSTYGRGSTCPQGV